MIFFCVCKLVTLPRGKLFYTNIKPLSILVENEGYWTEGKSWQAVIYRASSMLESDLSLIFWYISAWFSELHYGISSHAFSDLLCYSRFMDSAGFLLWDYLLYTCSQQYWICLLFSSQVEGPMYKLLARKEKAHEMDVNCVLWSPTVRLITGC